MTALRPNYFRALSRFRLTDASAPFIATFLLMVFGSHPALAQSVTTFGDVICSSAVNIVPYIEVFNLAAYAISGVLLVQGLLQLKNHYDNPGQNPHHRTVAMLSVGALLSVLPTVVSTLIDTLFGTGGGGTGDSGLGVCEVTEGAAGGSGSVPLDVMLTNFVNNIQVPIVYLTSAVAILLGVFLIMRGLMKASKYGTDPRTASPTQIITNLMFGTILVVVGQSVSTILQSVFGSGATVANFSLLNWSTINNATGGDTSQFQAAVQAALTFVQIVGFIAFVRGWNIIRHAVEGSGQATVPQGVTHIVGGVMAINIYQFVHIMDTTFGTNFFT